MFGSIWILGACFYTLGWLFLYTHTAYSACKACIGFKWKEFHFSNHYLTVDIYKAAIGSLKFLNISATFIMIAKGILVIRYVEPSNEELFFFIYSILDCLTCIQEIKDVIGLFIFVKKTSELEKREVKPCENIKAILRRLGILKKKENNVASDQRNQRVSTENGSQARYNNEQQPLPKRQNNHPRETQQGASVASGLINSNIRQQHKSGQRIQPITVQPTKHFSQTNQQRRPVDPTVPLQPVGKFGHTGQTGQYEHYPSPTQGVAVAMPENGPNAQNASITFFKVAEPNQTTFQGNNQNAGQQGYVASNLPYVPNVQNNGHTQYHPIGYIGQNQYPPPAQYFGPNGQWYY